MSESKHVRVEDVGMMAAQVRRRKAASPAGLLAPLVGLPWQGRLRRLLIDGEPAAKTTAARLDAEKGGAE